jgi:FixJ family two-component response regulator
MFGAMPLVARAETEASRHWGAARHVALSGVESLTPSERPVAQMAAEGPTNREIAQALFVTPKDGRNPPLERLPQARISSRAQLPAALA